RRTLSNYHFLDVPATLDVSAVLVALVNRQEADPIRPLAPYSLRQTFVPRPLFHRSVLAQLVRHRLLFARFFSEYPAKSSTVPATATADPTMPLHGLAMPARQD